MSRLRNLAASRDAWRDRVDHARGLAAPDSPDERRVYELVAEHFDHGFYLASYPDINRARRLDPVAHYIRAGAREGRDPSPGFSTRGYTARYPDSASQGVNPFHHWLTVGRAEGRCPAPVGDFGVICSWLGQSEADVWGEVLRLRQDAIRRLSDGDLARQVTEASDIDPEIAASWPTVDALAVQPVQNDLAMARMASLYRLQAACGMRPARVVVSGKAETCEEHLTRVIAPLSGAVPAEEVVVFRHGGADRPVSAGGARCVDVDECLGDLPVVARNRCLAEAVRSLGTAVLIDLDGGDSQGWATCHGRALSQSMSLVRVRADTPDIESLADDLEICAALVLSGAEDVAAVRRLGMLSPNQSARVHELADGDGRLRERLRELVSTSVSAPK